MRYKVERIDDNGKIIMGYKVEVNVGGAYLAFLEWIDFHLERTTPLNVKVNVKEETESNSTGKYRFHGKVTELEGEKRSFTY